MFDRFAVKHGLQHSFRYELPIKRTEFESTIFDIVQEEPLIVGLYSIGENDQFYGNFEFEEFVLKKRREKGEFSVPIARCKYMESDGCLCIEGAIHGLRTRFALGVLGSIFFFCFMLVLLIVFHSKLEPKGLLVGLGGLTFTVWRGYIKVIRHLNRAKNNAVLMKDELDRIFGSENRLGQNIILRISVNELNQIFEKKISCKDLVFTQGGVLGRQFNVGVSDNVQEIYYLGEKSDESLDAKAKSINELGGWVHFKNGTSYQLRNGIIAQIKLRGKAVSKISSISIHHTIDSYGHPEEKSNEMSADFFGLDIESVIFSFKSIGLRFYFDPESELLTELWLSYD